MRILYTIATLGHGNGGHYYDIVTTSETMARTHACKICEIGLRPSRVISSSTVTSELIDQNARSFCDVFLEFLKLIDEFKPDVIHSFDKESYVFGRIASAIKKIPIVLTKCGGPNPDKWYPYVNSLVTYSNENYRYFSSSRKYNNSNIYLIPNRSVKVVQDKQRINLLVERLNLSDGFKFIRICRLIESYFHSIVQAIDLVSDLNKNGKKSQLIIIGIPEDKEIFNKIVDLSGEHVYIVTDDYFTVNASELLHLGDAEVATGRSVMESAALGIPVLVPAMGSPFPELLTKDNIGHFMERNFSPRNSHKKSVEKNYNSIVNLVFKNEEYHKCVNETSEMFDSFFLIDKVVGEIEKVYSRARPENLWARPYDLLHHLASLTRRVKRGKGKHD